MVHTAMVIRTLFSAFSFSSFAGPRAIQGERTSAVGICLWTQTLQAITTVESVIQIIYLTESI